MLDNIAQFAPAKNAPNRGRHQSEHELLVVYTQHLPKQMQAKAQDLVRYAAQSVGKTPSEIFSPDRTSVAYVARLVIADFLLYHPYFRLKDTQVAKVINRERTTIKNIVDRLKDCYARWDLASAQPVENSYGGINREAYFVRVMINVRLRMYETNWSHTP